jgi:GTP-binding protein HflX
MLESHYFQKKRCAVAIGLYHPAESELQRTSSMDELIFLGKTLEINVVGVFSQKRVKPSPAYHIGKGKLDEIKEYLTEVDAEIVLFDNELTGIQARNLEKYLGKVILGRTELILNIFAMRARTHQAKLQVELAWLQYMMPRLRNRWDHFSRVEGGIGMRGGEGEKQIELDRRMIQEQINRHRKKLKKVDTQMQTQRKKRLSSNQVSLVGYTNAGKTTLINALAGTKLFSQDMLFATLDSTIRKVYFGDFGTVLVNDTVGFINKLPHSLVESFKSTLDEILVSNLLLHVIDASSPVIEKNITSVNKVLEEIGATDIPVIRVFNKIDRLENGIDDCIVSPDSGDVYISAAEGTGLDELKETISIFFKGE